MMMVKDVIFYSALALFIFVFVELSAGRFTDGPTAVCREDQFCGGYVPPIPPPDIPRG
jgi:hypothetical protein